GAVPIASRYEERLAPVPERAGTPLPRVALLIGALDEEAENNRRVAKLLERAGARVMLKIYDRLGHAFPKDRDRELRRALDFAFGKP
ncbi:MAG: hypothetical protein ABIT01_14220, partial [Thermoanaerobaculia bacterium]